MVLYVYACLAIEPLNMVSIHGCYEIFDGRCSHDTGPTQSERRVQLGVWGLRLSAEGNLPEKCGPYCRRTRVVLGSRSPLLGLGLPKLLL